MRLANRGSNYVRPLILFGFGLLFFLSEAGKAQEDNPLNRLRSQYEGAVDLLLKPLHDLNRSYLGALDRLLKEESDAGRLDNSLVIKAEIDAFGDGRSFDEAEYLKREVELSSLRRLRDTYLSSRKSTLSGLSGQREQLQKKYIASLEALEKKLTRERKFEVALAAKKERESILAREGGALPSGQLFEGRIHFIVKGEIEIRLNGEKVRFQNDSDNEQYILGESRPIEFRENDLLQIKMQSRANFRSLVMYFESLEKDKYIGLRNTDYRIADEDWMGKEIDPAAISGLARRPGVGPSDSDMSAMWRGVEIPEVVRARAQWTKLEEDGIWNYYVCRLMPDMVITTEATP